MTLRQALAAALLVLSAGSSAAQQEMFAGKSITIYVGYTAGGSYDRYGRLVSRHLGAHLPGRPTVVVQNMPGAGSLVAANYIYNLAPRDGTTFGLIARNLPLIGLLGQNPNVRFDPRKFTWLGSSSDYSDDAYVLIVRKDAPVSSIEEALRPDGPPLVLGGTATGGGSSDVPKILHDTIGINMRLVAGYRDSAAIYLAMESGEVQGRTTELSSIKSTRPGWLLADSKFRILLQYARATRLPSLADVPTAREVAVNQKARALIEFTEAPFLMAWPYAAPPELPPDRAAALQAAFMAVHRDPQFLQEAKATGADVSPVSAADLRRAIETMSRAPPETFDYVRRLLAAGKSG